jgi:ERCC4-type nuclease
MLVIVESNEGTDRDKKENAKRLERGEDKKDPSNIRMVNRLKEYFPTLQQGPLTCGDINVILENGAGILAIERKRAGDFLGSIGSGRIFRQVENMMTHATWPCIIVEGLISFDKEDMAVIPTFDKQDRVSGHETTGWRGVSVRGAMYAIQWSGCPIFTIEPSSLPSVVSELIGFCSKPSEHLQSLGRKRYVTFPPVSLSEEIIASFPGIGMKRSKSLLEFAQSKNDTGTGTLAEALSWGSMLNLIDRKSRPEGWGDKIIENFRATLGTQTGEYLTIQEDKQQIPKKKGKYNGK